MRDGDHGTPVHQPAQCFADRFLRLAVKRGCRLVEEKERRVLEERPRDGDARMALDYLDVYRKSYGECRTTPAPGNRRRAGFVICCCLAARVSAEVTSNHVYLRLLARDFRPPRLGRDLARNFLFFACPPDRATRRAGVMSFPVTTFNV